MSVVYCLSFLTLVFAPIGLGIPIFGIGSPESTAATTPVSADTVNSTLLRPAQFSRVAYCSSAAVTSWQCGDPCASLGPGIEVLQSGGDDGLVPLYFIAHDPSTDSLVVAHQGTDPANILSVANDVQFVLTDLNTTLFPGADGLGIQVHDGFQKTFERTSDGLLAGVQAGLASTGVNKVLVTGHSLGAAIATIDAIMLKRILDPSVEINAPVFGLPRVGNKAWADFVDTNLGAGITHVTNQQDPVPTVPPLFLDYVHPAGEIHINAVDANGDATDIVACPGQENENCSEGNSLLDASIPNHLGPYFDDISFGESSCPF